MGRLPGKKRRDGAYRRSGTAGETCPPGFGYLPLDQSSTVLHMRSGHPHPLLLGLFMVLLPTVAQGQTKILGRVIDDLTERPLVGAEVMLRTVDGRLLKRMETTQTGTFEFDVERVSAIRLEVRRLSYLPNTTPTLHFDGRKFFQVEVRLDPDAILLAPLEVIAWSAVDPSPFLEGFRERMKSGMGTFITRDVIEARRPALVADLLREVPGVTVSGGGVGGRPTVQIGRSLSSGCQTQIWVDGFLMNRRTQSQSGFGAADYRIDDAVSPVSIEAIEIYRGLSSVPAEFLNQDAECGVIAIWTRRGGRRN